MGRTHKIAGLIVDSRRSANDYPSGLRVDVWVPKGDWTAVVDLEDTEPVNRGGRLTLRFDPVDARYIRLRLTKPHGDNWF